MFQEGVLRASTEGRRQREDRLANRQRRCAPAGGPVSEGQSQNPETQGVNLQSLYGVLSSLTGRECPSGEHGGEQFLYPGAHQAT